MSLVFENELYDMTSTAKEVLLSDDLPWMYGGNVLFEEVPYYGNRTDIVTTRIDAPSAVRRMNSLGHLTPMPDERKYRHSYRQLQQLEPITRRHWIHEDSTYSTEQTCREVWDWFVDHGYLSALRPEEVGGQHRLDNGVTPTANPLIDDDTPAVTVKFPDILTINAWELKLRDVETAHRQAVRADCYADYRWVLMDAGGVNAGDHEVRKPFHDSGVGLATLGDDGFKIHVHAGRTTPPKTTPRQMLNERALADIPEEVAEDAREKFTEDAEGRDAE